MSDIALENYKKSVARLVDDWGKEMAAIGKELAPTKAELEKLRAIKDPTPTDKKRIDELQKKCEALRRRIEAAELSLKTSLMIITPPPQAPEKELVKIPDWLKEIIKKKGIPLGNVVITPKVDFDFKAKKLKSIGITIKF